MDFQSASKLRADVANFERWQTDGQRTEQSLRETLLSAQTANKALTLELERFREVREATAGPQQMREEVYKRSIIEQSSNLSGVRSSARADALQPDLLARSTAGLWNSIDARKEVGARNSGTELQYSTVNSSAFATMSDAMSAEAFDAIFQTWRKSTHSSTTHKEVLCGVQRWS